MSLKLESGAVLGGYTLLKQVGKGGMASVWVARGSVGGVGAKRLVAIKAMLAELASEEKFRLMFLQEGRLIQSISHEHVVQVLEVGEQGDILFMVMEWVEGDSLHALIAEANKRRPIPPEMAVRIIADTAAGLHAAHELVDETGAHKGVVHCDVSPQNILVGVHSGVKLVDFGVASAMNRLADRSQGVRGKFAYMSPEQTRGEPLDRRSDIFSLGIVLFELTTGYRLFKADTTNQVIEMVRSGAVPPPSSLRADYPMSLELIVLRALERDPQDRFSTALELQEALESYLRAERILVPSAGISALLMRVLGKRLNQQRKEIRRAVLELSDGASTDHIPTDADLLEGTGTAFVGTATLPPGKAPRRLAWLLGAAGLSLLGAALLWRPSTTPETPVSATASQAPTAVIPAKASASVTAPTPAPSSEPAPEASAPSALELTSLPKAIVEESIDDAEPEPNAAGTRRAPSDNTLLRTAAKRASACKAPGGPEGKGRVRLTIDDTGRVVSAAVSSGFAGTSAGRCVSAAFAQLRLQPGNARTLTRSFSIP